MHVCILGANRGQKGMSDPLDLELQMCNSMEDVSLHVDAGHQTQVFCKSYKCS